MSRQPREQLETDKKSRRAGFYWVEKIPYASVTTILKCIDKPALRWWYAKQVFLAMTKDPTLNEKEAMAAPFEKRDKAKARGSTIHSIIEAYKQEGIILKDIPEEFQPFAKAFYSWIKDNQVELLDQEKTVVSKKYKYAGTLDLLVKMKGVQDVWLVDIKTGKDIYPEAFLQMSAYKQALEENGGIVNRIAGLLLKEDGNYKFEVGESVFDVFLATMELWKWLNKDVIKEIGY